MTKVIFLCAALALPSIFGHHKWTPADASFFSFLLSLAPDTEKQGVIALHKDWTGSTRMRAMEDLPKGGFLVIYGKYEELRDYFKDRGWMMMPFVWRKHYYIYRKPGIEVSA